MTGSVTQVDQAAFGQQDQVVVIGRVEVALAGAVQFVHLRLDLFPVPVGARIGSIDLVVEMPNVADNRTLFQGLEHIGVADVNVTSGRHQQVDPAQYVDVDALFGAVIDAVVERGDQLKAVHAGLHRADRVDFADLDDHAFLTQ